MASVKIKFRPSVVAGQEGSLYYQVIHERIPRQIVTNYRVYPAEWNERRSVVVVDQQSRRAPYLSSVREGIRWDLERLTKIVRKFEAGRLDYSADEVIEAFRNYRCEGSLQNYMEGQIVKLRQNGKVRTAETYRSALNSFKRFNNGEDVMMDSITTEIMEAYEAWHRQRGVAKNTISFYMRILRAIYKRAADDSLIEDRKPFRHVYTGVDKTVKRALPLEIVRRIRKLTLAGNPRQDFARDMFMLSFMLRGMSFIDMAFLKKSDMKNGYIVYRRHKTGQQLTIEWTRDMQAIVDKYPVNATEYLLPIITSESMNERSVYRNKLSVINRGLKEIAGMLGLPAGITLYVARHSWASVARAQGVPVSVISEGMGHDSEATTKIYLASLDTSVVDRANLQILRSLR